MTTPTPETTRSYGCTFGCGNPYDFVIIDVASGTTEFLCLPDFARLAADLIAAVTDADDPNVIAAMAYATTEAQPGAPGPRGKRRGHNAPVTNADDDVFAAYDNVITAEELGDEFQ